ncbi:MAG: exosortase/archaeosortase family protein, partial [Candidatus Korobacteraceae bacterium]
MTPASSYRIFVVLWVASLLIWWQAIAATLALALHQDAYTHILLILPISIGLIGTEWNRRKWKPSPSILRGSALLGVAVLIGVAGLRWGRVDVFTGDVRLSLEILAVVMWWVGSFVCCFGGRIFRRCIFPLLFLLWLVPIPEFALDYIVYLLQLGSALAARLLFTMAGIPVSQDGAVVAIPGLTLEVAKECSSIRSSLMLLVTTMVMVHLLLRSLWGKTLITFAAIPLSIAKNGLRIFILSVLGIYVDPGFLNGRLHHQGGIIFFLLSLASLFVLIWIVGWAERKAARPALKGAASMGIS